MSVQKSVLDNNFYRRGGGTGQTPLIYLFLRPHRWGPEIRSIAMEQLLRIKDLQAKLAVSRSTTYRFIRAHHIPVIYVLGSPRVRASDIDRVLTSIGAM